MLGKTRHFVNHEIAMKLYKSPIVPVMDYSDVVYDC